MFLFSCLRIPEYEHSMPYVTEKIAKITVNPITLRPKRLVKKDSIVAKLQAPPFWRASRHVKLVVRGSDCVRTGMSSNMNIHEFSRSSDFWGGASIGVGTPTGHIARKKDTNLALGMCPHVPFCK